MVRIASLQDMALAENAEWSSGVSRRSFVDPDEIKLLNIVGQSVALYREGKESAALGRLLESRRELRYVPIPDGGRILLPQGVAERVRFGGRQSQDGSALRNRVAL